MMVIRALNCLMQSLYTIIFCDKTYDSNFLNLFVVQILNCYKTCFYLINEYWCNGYFLSTDYRSQTY